MKKAKDFLMGIFYGFLLGMSGTQLYNNLKYTTFAIPKYKVGDCLSNGLYLEKVLEIRKFRAWNEALYVTQAFFNDGKYGIPDTTPTWIGDKNWVLVNPKACK